MMFMEKKILSCLPHLQYYSELSKSMVIFPNPNCGRTGASVVNVRNDPTFSGEKLLMYSSKYPLTIFSTRFKLQDSLIYPTLVLGLLIYFRQITRETTLNEIASRRENLVSPTRKQIDPTELFLLK